MINNEEFTKRLSKVINYYGESASSFAEKIGVQRSSISHILSGRNKPSLEFILKIISSYPDVDSKIETNSNSNKSIERIVIFYSDGSFENYKN